MNSDRLSLVAIGLQLVTLGLVVSLWLFQTGTALDEAVQWAWSLGLVGAALVTIVLGIRVSGTLQEVRQS